MKKLRLLLLPFSWIYGAIAWSRNKLFDWNIFTSHPIQIKSIVVGNLSVGGTGKTPHVDYLIQHFLSMNVQLSVLSRGYGRKTKGLVHATRESSSEEIGDEPLLLKRKYGDSIEVVVSENRHEGVQFLRQQFHNNELILLDDAYQHRRVSAGMNILLTSFDAPFYQDHVLPAGNLREWTSGKNRADIVIVTKTPTTISTSKKHEILEKLKFPKEKLFFSSIVYGELIPICANPEEEIASVLLVTGIANPTPLVNECKKWANVVHLNYGDHYHFTTQDIRRIHEKFDSFAVRNKIIVTTEKDYVRLLTFPEIQDDRFQWHYQPMSVELDDTKTFKKLLNGYVNQI